MSKQLSQKAITTWARLLKSHRYLLEQVENDLKAADLPRLSWYDLLYELECCKKEGLRQYEIAALVLLSKHNLSRLLDRLEQKGLIRRLPCPEDGRGNCIFITKTGTQTLKNMWPVYAQAIQKYFSNHLSPQELQNLSGILDKLMDVI